MENRLWNTNKTLGKLTRIAAILLLAVSLIAMMGCTVVPHPRRPRAVGSVVYVQKAPPAPRSEVRPAKPNLNAVWIPGHWQWDGSKYAWKSGRWEKRPGGKAWVSGHWEKKPRGWVWVPGHWR